MIHFKNRKLELIRLKQQQQQQQIEMQNIKEDYFKKQEIFLNYQNVNIPFFLNEKYDSIIPRNLYTCWHTKELPPLLKNTYEILIKENPEFNHFLYDEEDCRIFIENNFDADVLNAYNSLIPCSYKSDLWRYCILYINGGIYVDIKFRCINGFKFIALTENELFVRDMQDNCVLTGLIVSKPRNIIIKNCIDQIVKNVKERFYGVNPLYPTGPGLLGMFFNEQERNDLKAYFTSSNFDKFKLYYIIYNNQIILQFNNDNYRSEQRMYQKNTHYHDLWHSQNIYT